MKIYLKIGTRVNYLIKLDLKTKQMEDFHGDGSVESQEYFCLNCKNKINNLELE